MGEEGSLRNFYIRLYGHMYTFLLYVHCIHNNVHSTYTHYTHFCWLFVVTSYFHVFELLLCEAIMYTCYMYVCMYIGYKMYVPSSSSWSSSSGSSQTKRWSGKRSERTSTTNKETSGMAVENCSNGGGGAEVEVLQTATKYFSQNKLHSIVYTTTIPAKQRRGLL